VSSSPGQERLDPIVRKVDSATTKLKAAEKDALWRLGLDPKADPSEVTRAYHILSRVFHPGENAGPRCCSSCLLPAAEGSARILSGAM
jgi:hypothetical protein